MKKVATIEIYIGRDSTFGQSTSLSHDGENWTVEVDLKDEEWETSSRGISATDRQLLESTLVHELGHIVQEIMKNKPRDRVKNEESAWKLGEKMGHVVPEIEKSAVNSYKSF